MLSINEFAENVFGSSQYNHNFIDSALALFNYQIDMQHACEGAGRLLLETMITVGLNPSTEQARRDQNRRLLSNTLSDQLDVQSAVEYVLSQMIVKPMGQAAECFAITACRSYLNSVFPMWDIGIRRSIRCHKIVQDLAFSTSWHQGADMLFFANPLMDWAAHVNKQPPHRPPAEDDLVVAGVAEVKSYTKISRQSLHTQMTGHLLRTLGGVAVPALYGQAEHVYEPHQIWYLGRGDDGLSLFSADDLISKSVPLTALATVCKVSVGPQPARIHANPLFNLTVAFSQDELERIGSEIALYTLGSFADQPDIDLAWSEWTHNLKTILSTKGIPLSKRQHARRLKIMEILDREQSV